MKQSMSLHYLVITNVTHCIVSHSCKLTHTGPANSNYLRQKLLQLVLLQSFFMQFRFRFYFGDRKEFLHEKYCGVFFFFSFLMIYIQYIYMTLRFVQQRQETFMFICIVWHTLEIFSINLQVHDLLSKYYYHFDTQPNCLCCLEVKWLHC